MDWVHCNNCFRLPGCGKRFYLTSCGHIYCSDCKDDCATSKCKLCGTPCNTIPLSSQMKPDVEMYFTDPVEYLKKHLKQSQQIAEFQTNHRARLQVHYKEQLEKYNRCKEEFKKTVKKLKECISEKKSITAENRQLKHILGNQCMIPTTEGGRKGSYATSPTGNGYLSDGRPPSAMSQCSSIKSLFSPPDPSSNHLARVSIRSPPFEGKMGIIPRSSSNITQTNILRHFGQAIKAIGPSEKVIESPKEGSQGSSQNSLFSPMSPNSPTYCTPEEIKAPTDRNLGSGSSGSRKIKLPANIKNGCMKRRAEVMPFSPADSQ